MTRTFYSLRYFNYRLWFGGALVANVGTWMQRVAQSWLVLTVLTANDGFAVGVVTGLQFLPVLIFSPYAGVLADRLPLRRLLMTTQALQGVLAGALGALVLAGAAELWHVYVFAFLLGTVTSFDGPARQTFVSEMVPADSLPNAVGLNSTSFNVARLIGPAVAGFLIAAVGTGWVFVINAVTFAATILALGLMRVGELHELPHSPRGKGRVRDGLAYVRGRSDIMVILFVVGIVGSLGLNFQLTSAVMATEVFGRGAEEYGVLGSVLAIGSLTGALIAARRKRPRVRLVIIAAFGFGVASGLQALAPTFELYAAASALVGLSSLTMMTSANATVQMSTEPAMRGRVMSLYMMVFMGTTPIGSPLVGWIADTWGARWSVGVGAIASLVVAVIAALWARKTWEVEVHYSRTEHPHFSMVGPGERHVLEVERDAAVRAAAAQDRAAERQGRAEVRDALGASDAQQRSSSA
ncbi:MFS transporter [Georgenia muralis]|uniref:Putative MFS family arabinose efflux permease n=1 Tax=Georgenia muralis TaxID=154117 RepID=A0A3N4Z104_9MICO|nr:MFS transporter [Georgenia muralis]RPF26277.1 putative MFS family arabinose efflux permease [Georgenia muralis]